MSGATTGNDTLNGTAGADTIDGLGGLDILLGNSGNDWLIADGGDTVSGGTGADTIIATGDSNVISGAIGQNPAQGSEDDLIVIDGDFNTVQGANGSDTIYLSAQSAGNVIDGGNGNGDFLYVSGAFTLVGGANPNDADILYTEAGANTVFGIQDGNIVSGTYCFAAGTRILTAKGETPVEQLRAGDLVATLAGNGAPMKPVLWIGHRRVSLVGNPRADMLYPIRVKAGALGDSTPHRDLLVSGDHCLYFDGALVPARLLVNGSSIVEERGLAEVHYYHVELESHDVLLAEGAPAESWLDTGNRLWFENGDVAMMQVDALLDAYGTGFDASRACAPLVHGGEKLEAIRATIAAQALTLATQAPAEEPARRIAAA
jgi:hypothetical protein